VRPEHTGLGATDDDTGALVELCGKGSPGFELTRGVCRAVLPVCDALGFGKERDETAPSDDGDDPGDDEDTGDPGQVLHLPSPGSDARRDGLILEGACGVPGLWRLGRTFQKL